MTHLKALAFVAILTPTLGLSQAGVPGGHFIENWDTDGSGAITLDEITTRRADVFYMFDVDANDVLDAQEYVLFDETRAADMENSGEGKGAHRMQEGLTLTFNDVDADGQVTMDEFVGRSAAWVEMIDRDGDGEVTAADFGPQN